jgi:hypothetical protein
MLASRRHLDDLHAVHGIRDFQMSFKPTVDQLRNPVTASRMFGSDARSKRLELEIP